MNAADAALLAAVFVAGGIEADSAHSFASRVVDWRDKDEQAEPGGAEIEDYRHAHVGYGPRNGPFESIGELRQVLGLEEIDPALLDTFTVYSTRAPLIVPEFAHPLVLNALQLLAHSQSVRHDPSAAFRAQGLIGQVVRVQACVDRDTTSSCRAVIARLVDDRNKPFLIYAWYTKPPRAMTQLTAE